MTTGRKRKKQRDENGVGIQKETAYRRRRRRDDSEEEDVTIQEKT